MGITNAKRISLQTYCNFRGVKELEFNETSFQTNESNSCGLFCIYYIIQRMHNLDLSFEELLEDIFDDKNEEINEESVRNFCSDICHLN